MRPQLTLARGDDAPYPLVADVSRFNMPQREHIAVDMARNHGLNTVGRIWDASWTTAPLRSK